MRFSVFFKTKGNGPHFNTAIVDMEYDDECCWGEVIRNICVNCGIDPDTQNGVTRNVEVRLCTASKRSPLAIFNYSPTTKISTLGIDFVTISVVEI